MAVLKIPTKSQKDLWPSRFITTKNFTTYAFLKFFRFFLKHVWMFICEKRKRLWFNELLVSYFLNISPSILVLKWSFGFNLWRFLQNTKAIVQRCSVEKVFLEISSYSQESTSARVSFLIKLQAPENLRWLLLDINLSLSVYQTKLNYDDVNF